MIQLRVAKVSRVQTRKRDLIIVENNNSEQETLNV